MKLADVCPRRCTALVTFGCCTGSPYASRRRFAFVFSHTASDFLDGMERFTRLTLSWWGFYSPDQVVEWYEKERMLRDSYWNHPRHRTLWEVPVFAISNHEYFYIVDWSGGTPEIIMDVGAGGWVVYANPYYLYIERPSGRWYVYRNYSAVSSYAVFMASLHRSVQFIRRIASEYTGLGHLVEDYARVYIVENASDADLYELWNRGGPSYSLHAPASEVLESLLTKVRERARRRSAEWLRRRGYTVELTTG